MKNIKQTIKVILTLAKLQMSSAMMYRTSFWAAFLADLTLFAIQLAVFGVIAQNGSIGGWNIYHLTVFTGTFIALDGLYMATYFFGVISIPDKIRTGTLDLAVVKPVNTLLYTAFGNINPGSFLLFIVGIGIVAYGGARLGVLTFTGIINYLVIFILMYVLLLALMLIWRCLSFWLTKVDAAQKIEETLVEFSFRLPLPGIYGVWKVLLFIVLPYGLISNMPSIALFGHFGFKHWVLCIGVTGSFLGLALYLWRVGMRRYDSSSS